MKKGKIILFVFVFLLVVGIAGILYYQTPVRREVSMILCSTDGRQIQVTMDVVWHRSVFAPTQLLGTITVDGEIYKDMVDTDSKTIPEFIEGIKDKAEGNTSILWFVRNPIRDIIDYHNNCVYVEETSDLDSFETVCLRLIREGEMETYYGPAKTAKEAEQLRLEYQERLLR